MNKYLCFILSILTIFELIPSSLAQNNCANVPPQGIRWCKQLQKWDDQARTTKKSETNIKLPPGAQDGEEHADFAQIASDIEKCMDLECVCGFIEDANWNGRECKLSNGQTLRKAVRKEYRTLSKDERKRVHDAFWALQENGAYKSFTGHHKFANAAGGAHTGPAFLPWHREYLKRFELLFRAFDPTLAVPYVDWRLDDALTNPADSVLFSDILLGEPPKGGGFVTTGTFKGWRTWEGKSLNRSIGRTEWIQEIRSNIVYRPMNAQNISFMMSQTEIARILANVAPKNDRECRYRSIIAWDHPEAFHGAGHDFVGGDMSELHTSSNDPVFWMHHSFVDNLWEQWRQRHQSRSEREQQYPQDDASCSAPQHFLNAPMAPFVPLINRDGLSNKYTDNLYEYAPSPTCSARLPIGCKSEFLFCDLSHGTPRCVSKLRVGSKCDGYRTENPCYLGECRNGRCVASSGTPRTTTPSTNPPRQGPKQPDVPETCYNEDKCCGRWTSTGECQNNANYMKSFCSASCGVCKPKYHLADDCTDRAPQSQCSSWSREGECQKNAKWMEENCRKSCNKCQQSRYQECSPGARARTTAAPFRCEATPGCYNENVCCRYWAWLGQCRTNFDWMNCNCRVSCGVCYPEDYNYGGCVDYHRQCAGWAAAGECAKNSWMTENCRVSCNSCFEDQRLMQSCSRTGGPGATAPKGSPRAIQRGPARPSGQPNLGQNWGVNNGGSWNQGEQWNQGGQWNQGPWNQGQWNQGQWNGNQDGSWN